MTRRGTGATSQQMIAAPQGAVFIVPPASRHYMLSLATHLNRPDLVITGPQILDGNGFRLQAKRYPAIIVDHATDLSFRQLDVLAGCRRLVTLRAGAVEASERNRDGIKAT